MSSWELILSTRAKRGPRSQVHVQIGSLRDGPRDLGELARLVARVSRKRGVMVAVRAHGGLRELLAGSGGLAAEQLQRLWNLVRPPLVVDRGLSPAFTVVAQSPREAVLIYQPRRDAECYLLPAGRRSCDILFCRSFPKYRRDLDFSRPSVPENDHLLRVICASWAAQGFRDRLQRLARLLYGEPGRFVSLVTALQLAGDEPLLRSSRTWRRWLRTWKALAAVDQMEWLL